jgi:hypothetical protein
MGGTIMYNPTLDGDVYHNDDITVVSQPLSRVNLITIDYERAAERNLATIRRNIRVRKEGLAKRLLMVTP